MSEKNILIDKLDKQLDELAPLLKTIKDQFSGHGFDDLLQKYVEIQTTICQLKLITTDWEEIKKDET